MSQIVRSTDADAITQPAVHDAKVTGLLLIDTEGLLMVFKTSNGDLQCLKFEGVERLRADDFRQGNIILDITISEGEAICAGDVSYAYGVDISELSFVNRTLERLKAQRRLVVRVNPSYGCSLVCICGSVSHEPGFAVTLG